MLSVLLAVLSLALYLRTMAPGLLPGDPGEFQFAAWRLGLAHPTGYPLYLTLGYLWQHLLALVNIAPSTALNALSALFAAVSVGLFYLLLMRWLQIDVVSYTVTDTDSPDDQSRTGSIRLGTVKRGVAALAAIIYATNITFWSQSLVAEVYTLHTLFILALFLLVRPRSSSGAPPGAHLSEHHLSNRRLIVLAAVAGLALTHHAATLLLLPVLLLLIHRQDNTWYQRPLHIWIAITSAALLPLLFYLYIPLRSGPGASPWYHQSLGDSPLTLYAGGWWAFLTFITGQSISAGFHEPLQALAGVPQALWLWWYHFGWPGLLLMGLGIAALARRRQVDLLLLTGGYAVLHQIFNLFYAIGDILVYYIPLYLVGAIWLAFGVDSIATGAWLPAQSRRQWRLELGLIIIAFLFLIPIRTIPTTAAQLDQTDATNARTTWETILAAEPPDNAILISNDRNDMPPLFYIQYVEGRNQGMTALFPKITPDERFVDIGATITTALEAELETGDAPPVYLIKEMPGMEVRFELEPAPPLVRVLSPVQPQFTQPAGANMGPLVLLGYTWQSQGTQAEVELFWQVNRPIERNQTTTVQVFAGGDKVTQSDQAPGGRYYPTSLWKAGEVLREKHSLSMPAGAPAPETLLIGMYAGEELAHLAPFLTLSLPNSS